MGWRFRRSLKIAPGVRLNLGRRSAGVSVGPRGAKVSVNTKREVRRTAGLPGTGLSHTTQTRLQGERTIEEPDHLRARQSRRFVGWRQRLLEAWRRRVRRSSPHAP